MSHFNVPYVPLQVVDDSSLVEFPVTVYYFIYDGRVLAKTLTFMIDKDNIDDDEYITKEAVLGNLAGTEKFRRSSDSNKILVHYTKSDRWICIKDRESVQVIADGPCSYEITGKEQTFLALAAEPV